MSLTIYRSSAGSGKTYTLAREYLKLALRSPDYYKQILAVTFTNRAAQEMKERVLQFLIKIAKGEHELIGYLSKELNIPAEEVPSRAKATLTHLLHHYGFFSISTIDTFFHRVIRSFSREIGLQGSFGIELEVDKVADFIASDIFTDIDDPQLRDWLIDFAGSKLGEGEGYEIHKELKELAKQLFSEGFKGLDQSQFDDPDAKEKLKNLRHQLVEIRRTFEDDLARIGHRFFAEQSNSGIELDEFNGGSKHTLPNFFKRLKEKNLSAPFNATILAAKEDASKWTSQLSKKREQIISFAEGIGIPLVTEASEYFDKHSETYFSAISANQHLYTLGLLSDLARRLQAYKQEEEVIMISDLPDFLSQIIDDSGSPFIYEKVGNRYKHFLIDEFQDTSRLQWRNFKPLLLESLSQEGYLSGASNENIIVGDAKQSIYSWRGGDPSLLLRGIAQDFPESTWENNTTNYRSAKEIVAFNNALFSRGSVLMSELMGDLIDLKGVEAFRDAYTGVEQEVADQNANVSGLVHVEFLNSERRDFKELAMARTFETLENLLAEGHDMNDMAMLVRTNRDAAEIVSFVLEYKRETGSTIEVISDDGMLIRNSPVVQVMLGAFKHLLHPRDQSILANLIFAYSQIGNPQAFEGHADFLTLSDENALPDAFKKHKPHLLHLPIFEMTEVIIRCFGLDQIPTEYAYLQAFQDVVLEYSKNHRSDVRLFLEWWEDIESKRSVKLTGALGAIEIITSHKAKGLQYPIVILPFCNFKMDSLEHTTWYASPFGELKSIPVSYKSSLAETAFAPYYQAELAKWHLESLNVLYVACTRAERALYAFCEPPPKEIKFMYGNASKLLWSFFEEVKPEGWDAAARVFHVGKLDVLPRKQQTDMLHLKSYQTNKWSNKLTIRKTGKAYYDDEVEKQRNEGILLHQMLSEITHWSQADELLSRYEARNEITKEDAERFGTLLKGLWTNDEIKSWFSEGYEVKTEVVVLPVDGETKRMDRVIIKENQAKVIDFKSGKPTKGDEMQVLDYVDLLKKMGYQAEGFLLYLKTGEVKKL